MITLTDGPAAGKTLMLRRAPFLLRVVDDGTTWDALDLPEDEPKPAERILVYVRIGEAGMIHIYRRRSDGGSGFYAYASYKFLDEQPTDAVMRDTAAWRQWCYDNGRKLKPGLT